MTEIMIESPERQAEDKKFLGFIMSGDLTNNKKPSKTVRLGRLYDA